MSVSDREYLSLYKEVDGDVVQRDSKTATMGHLLKTRFRRGDAMQGSEKYSLPEWIILATVFLLLPGSGCKLGAGAAKNLEPELDGGKYCLETMTQGPPVVTPIHFSYKQSSSDGSSKDYEVDLTPLSFDLAIHHRYQADSESLRDLPNAPRVHDGFTDTVRTNHYTRADTAGWNLAGKNVVLAATPWALFVAKLPSSRVGAENIKGYETIKYAVDTTHQSQHDKSGTIRGFNLMGSNLRDYNVTGTVWTTRDTGCIVQYFIESEKDYGDGTFSRDYYEGTITKQ